MDDEKSGTCDTLKDKNTNFTIANTPEQTARDFRCLRAQLNMTSPELLAELIRFYQIPKK